MPAIAPRQLLYYIPLSAIPGLPYRWGHGREPPRDLLTVAYGAAAMGKLLGLSIRYFPNAWPANEGSHLSDDAVADLCQPHASLAGDFLAYCRHNKKACPVLEVTDPGDPEPRALPGADLCMDLPRYAVCMKGDLEADRHRLPRSRSCMGTLLAVRYQEAERTPGHAEGEDGPRVLHRQYHTETYGRIAVPQRPFRQAILDR
jgi:hypothetical protein